MGGSLTISLVRAVAAGESPAIDRVHSTAHEFWIEGAGRIQGVAIAPGPASRALSLRLTATD